MEKIRVWSFPFILIFAWLMTAAYTLSSLAEAQARTVAAQAQTIDTAAAATSGDPAQS